MNSTPCAPSGCGGSKGFASAAGPFCSLINCCLLAYQFAVAVGSPLDSLGTFWRLLGAFWKLLESFWRILGNFWRLLGTFWGLLGIWRLFGTLSRLLEAFWGTVGVLLETYWAFLEAC